MKLKNLLNRLQIIYKNHGNLTVVISADEFNTLEGMYVEDCKLVFSTVEDSAEGYEINEK